MRKAMVDWKDIEEENEEEKATMAGRTGARGGVVTIS